MSLTTCPRDLQDGEGGLHACLSGHRPRVRSQCIRPLTPLRPRAHLPCLSSRPPHEQRDHSDFEEGGRRGRHSRRHFVGGVPTGGGCRSLVHVHVCMRPFLHPRS